MTAVTPQFGNSIKKLPCVSVLSCSRPTIRRRGGGMHLLINGVIYYVHTYACIYVFLFAYTGFRCRILYQSTQYSIFFFFVVNDTPSISEDYLPCARKVFTQHD